MLKKTLMLAFLLPLAGQARAEVVDVAWRSDGSFAHQGTVAAGKVLELCTRLAAGQKVRWAFEAAAPAEFNIHHHEGKQVVYAVQPAPLSTSRDTLNAASTQDYCWMWHNKSTAPLALKAMLNRQP